MSHGTKLPARRTAMPIHPANQLKAMTPWVTRPPLPPRRNQLRHLMNPPKGKAPSAALLGGATVGGVIETGATGMDAMPPKAKAMAMPMRQARLRHASRSRSDRAAARAAICTDHRHPGNCGPTRRTAKVATAFGNGEGNRSGQAQGRLVEQTRLKTGASNSPYLTEKHRLPNAVGFRPAFHLLSKP